MPHLPDPNIFRQNVLDNDVIPVHRALLADHLTPVSAFEVLGRDDHAFLFESVAGDARGGRYSYIGTSPKSVYEVAANGESAIVRADRTVTEFQARDPIAKLLDFAPAVRLCRDPALPTFTGGVVGYLAYDTARYGSPELLASAPPDDRHIPEVVCGLYDELVIFDHLERTIKVVANAHLRQSTPDDAWRDAARRVDEIVRRLQQPTSLDLVERDFADPRRLPFSSNMSQEQFEDGVRQAQRYIREGRAEHVLLSRRLRVVSEAQPFEVYRALRVIDASSCFTYLKSPVCTLIGASADIGCQSEGASDSRRLRESVAADSVCGAPKSGAMEIIDEIEPARRGPFGGALAQINLAGEVGVRMAQRMIIWKNGSYDVQTGSRILEDSDPTHAYEETIASARELLKAVDVAQRVVNARVARQRAR